MQLEVTQYAQTHHLSPRETEILDLLVLGKVTFKEIASELTLSPATVSNHFKNIFEKTHTNSKTQVLAKLLGIVLKKLERCTCQ